MKTESSEVLKSAISSIDRAIGIMRSKGISGLKEFNEIEFAVESLESILKSQSKPSTKRLTVMALNKFIRENRRQSRRGLQPNFYKMIADLSGVSETTIRHWEKDEKATAKFEMLLAVLNTCGYDLEVKEIDGLKLPSA